MLDILEYFFGRDHYETTLVTGEAFFLIVQDIIYSPDDVVKDLTFREQTMVCLMLLLSHFRRVLTADYTPTTMFQIFHRLLQLMTISDVRFLSCLLATLFDLLLFFDRLNNVEGGGKYGFGAYDQFFQSIEGLNGLLNHPNSDIANAAEKVDELLEKLATRNNI